MTTREFQYALRTPTHAGRDWLVRTPPPSHHPQRTPPLRPVALGLADVFVAGPWREDDLVARGGRVLGRRPRWLRPLVRRVLAAFVGSRPPAARVAALLDEDPGLLRAHAREPVNLAGYLPSRPAMWPAPGVPESWAVPAITTPCELAGWLGLTPGQLDGFADLQDRNRRAPLGRLSHYDYAWRPRPSGPARLIEAPRRRLKALQRRVLDEILVHIPPHEAAHGFRAGRSIRTFAAPHAGRRVVVRMDLKDFFPTVTAARVVAVFLTAGYPEPVARRLAGLCTNRVPRAAWDVPGAPAAGPDSWRARRRLVGPHLPQGAPSSPALANLCAYRLDTRLAGLAASMGATYTRYADDLVFSGDRALERAAGRFIVTVAATALEEGFEVNPRKTRTMRRGVRQRVAGVVVNDRPNVARAEVDRLEAILFNCVRSGPASQNRGSHPDFRAHLAGRVAHVAMLNPARGRKLGALLEAIRW
jgi:RNA-directed DNA polymerase